VETPQIQKLNKSKVIDYRIRYNSIKDSSFADSVIEALWSNGMGSVKKSDLFKRIFIDYCYEDLIHLIKSHQQRLVAEAEQLVACLYKVAGSMVGTET